MKLTVKRKLFIETAEEIYGKGAVLDKSKIEAVTSKIGGAKVPGWFRWSACGGEWDTNLGRGEYRLPDISDGTLEFPRFKYEPWESETDTAVAITTTYVPELAEENSAVMEYHNPMEKMIPEVDSIYVPFGHFKDVKNIIKSRMYYPAFITGMSGNGKTMMVEQACAAAKREFVRVNITIETDEDDLLGHYSLIDGNTVWQDGPVVVAMERGAVLLLDEIDLASNKIMCLQPVLEGKGVFLKKVNRFVKPAPGFNVLATANTKGKGSEDGRFVFTNIMNEAFLERFPITIEQEYPSVSIEKKILNKVFDKLGKPDSEFVDKLVRWADIIRKTFKEGAVDEIIATRRLVHIANAFAIFGSRMKAIELCVNRFDEDTKQSFLDLYSKVDADAFESDGSGETEAEEAHRMLDEESEENLNPF